MNATNIINVSKTIQEYQNKGGKKLDLPEIIKDIRRNYPNHPEWISSINTFLNPESEKEDTPLCQAYDKVKELFTKGFPSFKLINFPIPEVTVAKALDVVDTTIDKGGPEVSNLAINTLKLQNAVVEKKLTEMESKNKTPSENETSESPSETSESPSENGSDPKQGGSIYFTKKDCTFF